MLREDGSIKTAGINESQACSLYRKKHKIISLLMLIIGIAGTSVYVVLGTVLGGDTEDAPRWVNVFLLFAVPFALGLIGTITLARLKKREKAEGRETEITFYADCFFYSYKTATNSTETVDKISYSDAVLKGINEKYGYIFVFGKGIFVAFGTEGLDSAELNAIRKNFRHPVPDTESISKLENYKPNEEN